MLPVFNFNRQFSEQHRHPETSLEVSHSAANQEQQHHRKLQQHALSFLKQPLHLSNLENFALGTGGLGVGGILTFKEEPGLQLL